MNSSVTQLLLVIILLSKSILGFSQKKDLTIIPRIPEEIKLDGIIDEAAWEKAKKVELIQNKPDFGKPASQKTVAYIGYTDDYIYAACQCYDTNPPLASSYKRDYVSGDSDWFEIVLDTFNDNENVTLYAVTPTGSRTDATVVNDAEGDSPLDKGWNNFWDAEVKQNSKGWFVEMRIPISGLTFQKKDGQVVMGLSIIRILTRYNESTTYPQIEPNWPISVLKASQAKDVAFKDLKPKRLLRITPYALAGLGQENKYDPVSNSYSLQNDPTLNAGLDVKYGINSNMMLNLTINTDFAQVEADNQQVNLTRFPLFFPEKREFFLERASNFAFNFGGINRLFYTRRIGLQDGERVPILGGLRLVGRQGPWDIGFLNMQTGRVETENNDILSPENFGVLRLRRRIINPYSYIGGILTSRLGTDGSYNLTYGLDGIFRLTQNDYLSVKYAQSFDDQYANELISLEPTRFQVQWERRTQEGIIYNLQFDRAGEKYVPELGFELRQDYYRIGNSIGYGWIPDENSSLQRHQADITGEAFFNNTDGSLQTLIIGPQWLFSFNSGHTITFSANHQIENLHSPFFLSDQATVDAGLYDFQNGQVNYQMPVGWPLRASIRIKTGGYFNGWQNSARVSPTWNISSKFRLSGTYEYNKIEFPEQDFNSQIGRIKIEVTPNVKLSLMSFLQYNSIAEGMSANIRLRYNPRDGNDLYFVYNENLNTNRKFENPVLPLSQGRAFIIKYTHTFHNF